MHIGRRRLHVRSHIVKKPPHARQNGARVDPIDQRLQRRALK